ncbi:putative F-box-like domain protein [Rhizoctonia solani 123E]|uniref:Putative F-box-like domain protein n=1 Tax=Rhizoctonia solani 123E TaxID=1423351 RepID=A0A074SAJ1_9AGAM|nr:putative F-box-like domain protein [Rhizoctonia solani 123E]
MARWVSVLNIRTSTDWDTALRYRNSVRELNCLDGCFDTTESKSVLGHFHRLYTISIDAHGDVQQNPNTGRFVYHTIIARLPSTVLRLHVKHAHGPDMKIIELVKRYAPSMRELWLGRCTMFNRSPACKFWSAFPFDHDSYIALEGAEDYVQSLAQELSPLKQLASLHMGIYLAPSNIVLAHRAFHSRQLVAPHQINWEHAVAICQGIQGPHDGAITSIDIPQLVSLLHTPLERSFSLDSCSFCRDLFLQDRIYAERQVNGILRGLTGLKSISWMNWFSYSHLGLSQEE